MDATFYLSNSFHYLSNAASNRAFLLDRTGRRTAGVINRHAFDLLTGDDRSWQRDPDYAPFLEKATSAGWLVPSPPTSPPVVRTIDRRHHLKRLQYEVNLVCNLECAHCYCSSSPRAPQGQPTEFVLDVIRQAAELGVLNFDVTGGEPLARRDIIPVLTEISERGMIPGLYTNGTLVTPEKAREIHDTGVRWAQVSLDARTPALHDELRGKQGAFERATKGVRALQAAGIRVRVAVCLSRRNVHEVDALVEFLRDDLRVDVGLDRVIPAGRGCGGPEPLAIPAAEYYAIIRRFMGRGSVAGKACDAIGPETHGSFIEPSCGVGTSYLFLKHDGRAALCPTMTEAESPDFVQADLTTMSLAEAWENHPTFRAFRGMQCENAAVCPSGRTCAGGCRSNAYLLHGRIDSPDEVNCNIHKNDGIDYRPMLEEYEALRRQGKMPARRTFAKQPAPLRRSLKVVA
jgi:radical SAM protein with 4Fe4S-binding SPASM domain